MRHRLHLAVVLVALALAVAPAAGQEGLPGAAPAGSSMTLAELEAEIAEREVDLQRYGERLERLEAETTEVRAALETRVAELRQQEAHVRARIVTLCRLRQGGYLHLLRGAGSLSELVRRLRFLFAYVDSAEEIHFGGDYPFTTPTHHVRFWEMVTRELDFTEEEKHLLFYENARRVFHLPLPEEP